MHWHQSQTLFVFVLPFLSIKNRCYSLRPNISIFYIEMPEIDLIRTMILSHSPLHLTRSSFLRPITIPMLAPATERRERESQTISRESGKNRKKWSHFRKSVSSTRLFSFLPFVFLPSPWKWDLVSQVCSNALAIIMRLQRVSTSPESHLVSRHLVEASPRLP